MSDNLGSRIQVVFSFNVLKCDKLLVGHYSCENKICFTHYMKRVSDPKVILKTVLCLYLLSASFSADANIFFSDKQLINMALNSTQELMTDHKVLRSEIPPLVLDILSAFCPINERSEPTNARVGHPKDYIDFEKNNLILSKYNYHERTPKYELLDSSGSNTIFVDFTSRGIHVFAHNKYNVALFTKLPDRCAFRAVRIDSFDEAGDLKSSSYLTGSGQKYTYQENPASIHPISFYGQRRLVPKLAIIDDGINYNSPNFQDNFQDGVLGWDFTDNDHLPNNERPVSHGNAVALAAKSVFPEVQLISIKTDSTLSGSSCEYEQVLIDAVNKADLLDAKVVNLSFSLMRRNGLPSCPNRFENLKAVIEAKKHMLFVVSAGNKSRDLDLVSDFEPPAWFDLENLIVVGAVDSEIKLAEYSNYGLNRVHLGAKGDVNIETYSGLSIINEGTSFSGPRVAATAVKAAIICQSFSGSNLKQLMLSSVSIFSYLTQYFSTSGVLNVNFTIKNAHQSCE